MARVRHIAIASDHPGKAADFFTAAFGFRELYRSGLDPANPDVAPRPSVAAVTDGELNITFLKVNQLGGPLDFLGIHHFGIEIENMDDHTKLLEGLGAPCIAGRDAIPAGAHEEIKFRGPDNVVFDIAERPWPGTPALSHDRGDGSTGSP